MDLQADAVPQRVDEELGEPGLGQAVARDRSASTPDRPGRSAATASSWASRTASNQPRSGSADRSDRDGAGHVGVVAVDARAEVERDEVAALEHALRWRRRGASRCGDRRRR